MCNFFKKCISIFIVILKLCIQTFGQINCPNFTIHDLRVICGITDGDAKIDVFPPQCTAIAAYSNDMDRLHNVLEKKGSLPFVIIIDSIDYNKIQDFDAMDNELKNVKYDFVVYDLQRALDIISAALYSELLEAFITSIKVSIGTRKFGFLLHNDISWFDGKIDFGPLNERVDFFLLQSTGYDDCKFKVHQRDMPTLATKENVQNSIQQLKDKKIDISKSIFTIELKIESRTMFIADSKHMGYSYLCSNKLSVNRKYCVNSVDCLFEKARLRVDFNVLGVFIMGIEYDDVDGTCGCKTASDADPKYRGLKTIAGASQEGKNGVDFYRCKEGEFPVIL